MPERMLHTLRGSEAMRTVSRPERTLMPATVKKANLQPSTPIGRCAPMLVAKKAPAMPPVHE
jgi:hypothetical protein